MAVLLFLTVFAASVLVAFLIAEKADRTTVSWLVAAGLLFGLLKIWVIQQFPQWGDTPLDVRTYILHAEALADHWQGIDVEAVAHRLLGFLAIHGANSSVLWPSESSIAYVSVLGTREWLYAAYLALWKLASSEWQMWAIFSNAALAALFPAAAFGIARALGGSNRVALLAAAMGLVDPSIAVNGSWLLKDTLVAWAALGAIWSGLRLLRKPEFGMALTFALLAGSLGALRFVAFCAVLAGIMAVAPLLVYSARSIRPAVYLMAAGLCSVYFFSLLYAFPNNGGVASLAVRPMVVATAVLSDQKQIIADPADPSDQAVDDWQTRLKKNPALAIATSASRTLFAPYPWLIANGLTYSNSTELYYLSSAFWLLVLPGIVYGIIALVRRPRLESIFLFAIIFSILAAYTLFFGEWSTRQRIFMMPAFFAISAVGWGALSQQIARTVSRRLRVESHSVPTK